MSNSHTICIIQLPNGSYKAGHRAGQCATTGRPMFVGPESGPYGRRPHWVVDEDRVVELETTPEGAAWAVGANLNAKQLRALREGGFWVRS